MTKTYTPLCTEPDDNCLYRAASLGLYNTQSYHLHLRLVAALEILENRPHYDSKSVTCVNVLKFAAFPTITPESYDIISNSACTVNASESWAHLLHVYALSAALNIAIQSYSPPTMNMRPLTRNVFGRSVSSSVAPALTVMWTNTVMPAPIFIYPGVFYRQTVWI